MFVKEYAQRNNLPVYAVYNRIQTGEISAEKIKEGNRYVWWIEEGVEGCDATQGCYNCGKSKNLMDVKTMFLFLGLLVVNLIILFFIFK